MKVGIKICGMREPENIVRVADLQPDYMGFIFYEQSPRCVPIEFSIPKISSMVHRVGVFVNESHSVILKNAKLHSLEFVQLHGAESPDLCRRIRSEGIKLIKSFSVDHRFDFHTTDPYKHAIDFFLFDTKGTYPGGNAISFDWTLLSQYDQEIPFFLSGGISRQNILKVKGLKEMNIKAIDVNSGVEDGPGIKNIKFAQEIISSFRSQTLNLEP
jgi:phosphoribosylanthranilate isomerase